MSDIFITRDQFTRMIPRLAAEYFPPERIQRILDRFEIVRPRDVTRRTLDPSATSKLAICSVCSVVYEVQESDPICIRRSGDKAIGPVCYPCAYSKSTDELEKRQLW